MQKDTLSDDGVQSLLELHSEEMKKYSPGESIHALDVNSFRSTSLTFWSARINKHAVGCGALKELSSHAGEVKSMKTDSAYTRKGIAQKILSNIIAEAKARDYKEILLETGTNSAFEPAVALYIKNGFHECGPFGDYVKDPYSKFLRKDLVDCA